MDIHVFNQQDNLKIHPTSVETLVQAFLTYEKAETDEVAVHFVDVKTISNIHKTYFDDPSPTDCISFPMDEPGTEKGVLGEVFVCPQVAIEYAKEHGGNPYEETSLYVVHGLLHLLAYDDIEEADRAEMRKAEQRHLENLKELKALLT